MFITTGRTRLQCSQERDGCSGEVEYYAVKIGRPPRIYKLLKETLKNRQMISVEQTGRSLVVSMMHKSFLVEF